MSGPTNPSEAYFDKGLWGWDGSQWQKLALLFGYTATYSEDLGNLDPAGGTYSKLSTAVPAGYVYVVEAIAFMNATGTRGQVNIIVNSGGVGVYLKTNPAPVMLVADLWSGKLTLAAGDYVIVQQFSVTAGDDLYAGVCGYKMKVT